MIPLPSIKVAAGALAIGYLIGLAGGWSVRGWKEDAAKLQSEREAAEDLRKEQQRGNDIAAGWAQAVEVLNQQASEREGKLRAELGKEPYRTCAVPDGGGLLLGAEIDAANAARKSGAAMPGTAAPGWSNDGRPTRP